MRLMSGQVYVDSFSPIYFQQEVANANTKCSGTIVRMQHSAGTLATTRHE